MTREHLSGVSGGVFLDEDRGVRLRVFSGGRGAVRSAEASVAAGRPERVGDPEGRLGWRVRLPGGRPLATPAVSGGRVFVGGGFGSHEVFAFDGESGERVWQLPTKDDGPTAATVAGDFVAFNTESCTVYVVEAETGRVVWERWLGDPLMAQPAVDGSRLFMAYPDREGRHVSSMWSFQGSRPEAFDDGVFGVLGDTIQKLELADKRPLWRCRLRGDTQPVHGMALSPPAVTSDRLYITSGFGDLFVLDRETGEELWALAVGSPIVSQPAVAEGRVFFGTVDGTLYSFEAGDDGDAAGWPMWGGGPGHNGGP
jgi:outer membrane protein assembly factor BamB